MLRNTIFPLCALHQVNGGASLDVMQPNTICKTKVSANHMRQSNSKMRFKRGGRSILTVVPVLSPTPLKEASVRFLVATLCCLYLLSGVNSFFSD